ncbi:MAG: hypothetical protein ACK41D_10600 [Rubricoccaceae bacterium]
MREAQARETVERLAPLPDPVLLAGRLAPEGSPAYVTLIGPAGFADAWPFLRPGDPGLTCCHPPTLTGAQALSERSTLVLARGDVLFLDAERLGLRPGQRTRTGRWPAPHGGLVVRAQVRP